MQNSEMLCNFMVENQKFNKNISLAMITEDKVTEFFCIADDFCKEFNAEIKKNAILPSKDGKKHRNRATRMGNAEIMTIRLAFHYNSFRNFKHYYCQCVCKTWRHLFPGALSYNRENYTNRYETTKAVDLRLR